ncbi:Asparagine-rich protein 1, asparagine-rich protein [Hibiscus trionum]|uniref:Asparagine-rich protein 1, asparagine-rich protein n=1 Tax=Hibiscus trionum TaxID=183268 RepID=A0A9W7ISF9_HIBTR|nr:Asparagine-rich protein 1, asparagine-rich protein [Hibiscus trionum]
MENNNQQSFWQFSDQLRVQNSNLANLSLNDSIWSNTYLSKRPDERRNFDIRVGGDLNSLNNLKPKLSDFNSFSNDGWKIGATSNNNIGYGPLPVGSQKNIGINGGFNKGIYSNPVGNNNFNVNLKFNKNKGEENQGIKSGKNKKKNSDNNSNENKDKDGKTSADKRFKTLPPSESLPRNETVGGYIFVCNNDTMEENLRRQLFGLPPRYRDSVRAITPGLPLFLYNYSTHQLHGVFEAASFGGTNIDPTAWEDKKCHGESRFPAQVRVITRKICEPLEEDSFRPILHHYDGPKFRLELNIPEALSLLDIFAEQGANLGSDFNF